jgi:hypothetical protein
MCENLASPSSSQIFFCVFKNTGNVNVMRYGVCKVELIGEIELQREKGKLHSVVLAYICE